MHRQRVLEPGEEPPQYVIAGHEPQNLTAFRQAERLYRGKKPVDLSTAIDFTRDSADPRVFVAGRYRVTDPWCGSVVEQDIYGIHGHEGFLYIPSAIPIASQVLLATRCFSTYINPPNVTNLNAHYDFTPHFHGYLDAYRIGSLQLMRKADGQSIVLNQESDVESLIRKIRWATLGFHYNWTSKQYNFDNSPNPFPPDLAVYCQTISTGAGFEFCPEAGIINYYQPGDSLTGHVDRSERNMSVPLLSLSLGLSAIFLIGGAGRNDPVSAVIVRSGDVSLLSGPSRHFYHGVPRVLEGTFPDAIFGSKVALLRNSRININVRQVN